MSYEQITNQVQGNDQGSQPNFIVKTDLTQKRYARITDVHPNQNFSFRVANKYGSMICQFKYYTNGTEETKGVSFITSGWEHETGNDLNVWYDATGRIWISVSAYNDTYVTAINSDVPVKLLGNTQYKPGDLTEFTNNKTIEITSGTLESHKPLIKGVLDTMGTVRIVGLINLDGSENATVIGTTGLDKVGYVVAGAFNVQTTNLTLSNSLKLKIKKGDV